MVTTNGARRRRSLDGPFRNRRTGGGAGARRAPRRHKTAACCRIACTLHKRARFRGTPAGRSHTMARRMRRLGLLAAVVAIPLALWAVLPIASSGRPRASAANLQDKIDAKRERGREEEGPRACAVHRHRVLLAPDRPLQGDIDTLQAPPGRASRPTSPTSAPSSSALQRRLRDERERLQRLRARLAGGARDARHPPRRDVQGRPARHGHGRARVPGLRGPPRAHRVHAPGLPPGHPDHDVVQGRQGRRRRDREAPRPPRAPPAGGHARRRAPPQRGRRDQGPARRPPHELRGRALDQERGARLHARRLASTSRATSGRSRRSRPRSRPRCSAPPAAAGRSAGLRAASSGRSTARSSRRSASAGAACTRASTSPRSAGTPIRAADSGKVVLLGWTGGYGNYTCIQHNASLSTCYAHQSSYSTSNGASVSKGQVIGPVGCTGHCFGDHLHFETRVNGSPVNPAGYL